MVITEMTDAECRHELASGNFGRLGCARDNQPYIVPINFVFEDDVIYSFALPGQKIDWMRINSQVCVEIDTVQNGEFWTSVVAMGRFEELTDTPAHNVERARAHELLQRRPMWWQPGATAAADGDQSRSHVPIFYRINVDQLSGYRGVPDGDSAAPGPSPG